LTKKFNMSPAPTPQSRLSTAPPPPSRPVLYEAISYKRILDDTLHSFVEVPALKEDLSYHNFKILVMAVSSVSALIAQFYPIPFPGNRLILLVCVIIYFALSGVYQFLVTFVDRDSVSTFSSGKKEVVLRSTLHKYSDEYTAIVECPSGNEIAKFTRSIGNYFTKEGDYAEQVFKKDIEKLLLPALKDIVGGDKKNSTSASSASKNNEKSQQQR
jgi:signal peptidase complex subunit 2